MIYCFIRIFKNEKKNSYCFQKYSQTKLNYERNKLTFLEYIYIICVTNRDFISF